MRKVFNTATEQFEGIFPATIKSINLKAREAKNDKKTPFLTATVAVVYPGDTKPSIVGAMLWKASHDALPASFATGEEVEIAVQLEGEHAGNCKIQLPALAKFDLSKVEVEADETEATKATAEELKEQA